MSNLSQGDCMQVLKTYNPNQYDSLVTDPPAGIGFMGKDFDKDRGGRDHWIKWLEEIMKECHRVLKPGAHGFVWALPRTSHWTATALENAGFQIREIVTHVFGSGFPKSHNISKGIDKKFGAEREIVGSRKLIGHARRMKGDNFMNDKDTPETDSINFTAPSTDAAKQWDGYGTALKPASEHWILIRKPLSEKTIVDNVLKWGTGGIDIDGSRIGKTPGRFPANFVLSHSEHCDDNQCDIECAIKMLDEQSLTGGMHSAGIARDKRVKSENKTSIFHDSKLRQMNRFGDNGGASRFFYCAKPSKRERNAGCEGMPEIQHGSLGGGAIKSLKTSAGNTRDCRNQNYHPTVKSKKLMSYLINMITPPNGTVLDPFMGSGSTGVACKELGFEFIGIEKEKDYFEIAEKRIAHVC